MREMHETQDYLSVRIQRSIRPHRKTTAFHLLRITARCKPIDRCLEKQEVHGRIWETQGPHHLASKTCHRCTDGDLTIIAPSLHLPP